MRQHGRQQAQSDVAGELHISLQSGPIHDRHHDDAHLNLNTITRRPVTPANPGIRHSISPQGGSSSYNSFHLEAISQQSPLLPSLLPKASQRAEDRQRVGRLGRQEVGRRMSATFLRGWIDGRSLPAPLSAGGRSAVSDGFKAVHNDADRPFEMGAAIKIGT